MASQSKGYDSPTTYLITRLIESSIYASQPFKFVVNDVPMFIHAELVSLHSKPLDRMINGHMAEAQESVATLRDVDEATFNRFIQWAYTGYYFPADYNIIVEPEKREEPEENHLSSPTEDVAGFAAFEPQSVQDAPVDFPGPDFTWAEPEPEPAPIIKKRSKGSSRQSLHRTPRETIKHSFTNRKTTVRHDAIQIPAMRSIPTCSYPTLACMSLQKNMTSNH